MMLHVVEALDLTDAVPSPNGAGARFFRPLGEVRSLSKNHICSRSFDFCDAISL